MKDLLEGAKSATGVLSELKEIAGDSDEVRKGQLAAGRSFKTLTVFLDNTLLPLAAVNYAMEKAKNFFSGGQFEAELKPKIADIPWENIVEPKPSIAGPALQGISYSLDEPQLKELYLNLIAKSMDGRAPSLTHPSFVEIVKQLSSEEAVLLKTILEYNDIIPIVCLRNKLKPTGYSHILYHIANLKNTETGEAEEIEQFPSFVDNWIRLGLIDVSYTEFLVSDAVYDWVTGRPEYLRSKEIFESHGGQIDIKRGRVKPTSFGAGFGLAVGLRASDSTASTAPGRDQTPPPHG